MKVFRDQLNREVLLEKTPQRIVSLVPSITELVVDLGLEKALVGVTKFCVHPSNLRTNKVIVGGTKSVHIDKIKALKPDLILCNKEENTKAIVDACETFCAVHVSDVYTVEDSIDLIRKYSLLLDCSDKASQLIDLLYRELADFKTFIKDQPILKVAYFIWQNPYMVAANNTLIDNLLNLNKLENVFGNELRYPEITLSDHRLQKANLILLSSEPFPFKEEHEKRAQEDLPNATVLLVDGEFFSWFGSRLIKAFSYFKMLRLNLQKNQL